MSFGFTPNPIYDMFGGQSPWSTQPWQAVNIAQQLAQNPFIGAEIVPGSEQVEGNPANPFPFGYGTQQTNIRPFEQSIFFNYQGPGINPYLAGAAIAQPQNNIPSSIPGFMPATSGGNLPQVPLGPDIVPPVPPPPVAEPAPQPVGATYYDIYGHLPGHVRNDFGTYYNLSQNQLRQLNENPELAPRIIPLYADYVYHDESAW